MNGPIVSNSRNTESLIQTNKVLRNTYFLLSLTLLWSAGVAGVSMAMNLPHPGIIITLVGFYGLLFLTEKNRNNSMGLVFTFLFTGFMGYTLGPILNAYIGAGMGEAIVTALGGTALAFIGASAYAMTTKRDLSVLGGLMLSLFVVLIGGMIASFFFQSPVLSLALSSLFIVFSTMAILMTTQSIIRGGETNYISATVTLYVSIYNMFISLLSILGIMNDD
ncbi:Putative TEGT family carrier/transport protein [Vibrio nigripulchritudo SFn27]|jgi:modulator of FtsH protease|uniref:Putative TEGT family carrier/transport protein n=1 Tax=Vibrio nigripulchritudo TaxID=28173 RepID=U4K5N9_9VIBR|nr:Bax inhibitor-1/YccA family protein [Vibrio nigripulchritudo]KJY71102.1 membrane protein [Vibrio nigripulchritudo]CCN73697.1 Putative TEGT family carrier/transport protein [Vibrio nigripulchritudo SFn118]CCN84080.1 Putative TEGT family carrier/transport protein [Vibrio nigripulchritudo BLFn1]CCN86995.1 Putative TEGT family carrier/transport protein [Vibrio nigripulchritudo SFn27]CCN93300.1 Putative TEGT family carrier/transport protein [Vibrio nigripulchritudo ENn2]